MMGSDAMRADRLAGYRSLEARRQTKIITYVTGDRPGLETQMSPEAVDNFVHHLDTIGHVPKLSLFLYTRGGSPLAAWSIANLLHQFCDQLEVIIPAKALSAGTLLSLAADTIVMTKQATLGPIDPSVNGPLNPDVPGAGVQVRVPVSVEAINGFVEFAKTTMAGSGSSEQAILSALNHLASRVHPLVLGDAYRVRAQIRMLAKRLVARQLPGENATTEKVLDFLCSESGSHDYTIYRREARDGLGLAIQKPDDEGYKEIKALYDDIAKELELTTAYDPNVVLGNAENVGYSFRRSIVESVDGGCHVFLSEGAMIRVAPQPQMFQIPGLPQVQVPMPVTHQIQDKRTFEGWRHEL